MRNEVLSSLVPTRRQKRQSPWGGACHSFVNQLAIVQCLPNAEVYREMDVNSTP